MLTLHLLSRSQDLRLPVVNGDASPDPDGPMLIEKDGVAVTALPMPARFPDDAPLRACEGNLFWPKAAEVVAAHKSHVVLAASHPGEGWEARRAEMLALLGFAARSAHRRSRPSSSITRIAK